MAEKTKKYKLKTYKAAAKRFKITKTGKVMRTKGGKSHLRRKKADRSKRLFGKMIEITTAGDKRRVKRLAPYLKKYG